VVDLAASTLALHIGQSDVELEVRYCVRGVVSPLLANIYLHWVDRAWQTAGVGVLVRYADDLVVLCRTEREAVHALEVLTAMLADLGLEPKATKTRIVHLEEGGEGVDFLGFHHRWVRAGSVRLRHVRFLARWPSNKAMQRIRDRIRELTDRRRLLLAVEWIVEDLNRSLRDWAGYFRSGTRPASSTRSGTTR
jgi:hypothetical protein